jgi:hypothetical protein
MAFAQNVYTDDIKNAAITIGGDEWYLIEARVELSTAATPNFVDVILSPTQEAVNNFSDNPTKRQSEGGLLGEEFVLEVDTELDASPRTDEQTRIFTGALANLSPKGDGSWEGIAWDPSHQSFAAGEGKGNEGNFLNTEITLPASVGTSNASDFDPTKLAVTYSNQSVNRAGATKIQAVALVERIINKSPLDDDQVETNFADPPGVRIGEQPDGTVIYGGVNRELSFDDQKITVSQALERITKSTNSAYWFDENGVFNIGAAVPGDPIEQYDLSFITDTSAGKTTPAWQSVQVIGSGVVSEDGWNRSNLNTATPALSAVRMSSDGKTDTDALAEPVYTYRNLEIQTQAEADAVAEELVNELRKQQAEGKVTVVGFPEIRPLDAITMPDSKQQPMGGERYAVEKVVHKINASDGFITDIHVGGLTRENSTMYTDEIESADFTSQFIAGNTTEGLAQGDGI